MKSMYETRGRLSDRAIVKNNKVKEKNSISEIETDFEFLKAAIAKKGTIDVKFYIDKLEQSILYAKKMMFE